MRGGEAAVDGDFELSGVAGRGARIALDFVDPGHAATGRLLPTGHACDVIEGLQVSCVDATNPMVFVRVKASGAWEQSRTPKSTRTRPSARAWRKSGRPRPR